MGWNLFRSGGDPASRIRSLRERRNAVLLAHLYERPEVQDVADHVGDSLELSRIAASTPASVIVFCSVRFMAETAKILSPGKTVLLPVKGAGCPLADFATPEQVRNARREHPAAAVVSYVNTSAAVKAVSDYCCTSANALQVVESVPGDEVVFLPDRNLGRWVAAQTSKKVHLWPGHCPTHQNIRARDVERLRQEHPKARVLAHPECSDDVRDLADLCLSTSQMVRHCGSSSPGTFIICTETGIRHRLEACAPANTYLFPGGGAVCPNMKKTTLADVVDSLEEMKHEIVLEPDVIEDARRALDAMLAVRATR
jgi:quinolinate synthase